jgi:hypothetical protein
MRPDPSPPAEKKAAPAPKPKAPQKPSLWPWGPWFRTLVSLLIAFHITAVFSAPWFIQLSDVFEPALPPGRVPRDAQGRVIPLAQLDPNQYPPVRAVVPAAIAGPMSPFPLIWHYANLLYINNGYDFFSPDPSFSHLIRYEVRDAAGQTIAKGEWPNRQQQWPRLLYHRYMMLVDQSSGPGNANSGWETHIADGLMEHYNGASVHMTMVRHNLLTAQEVIDGRRLIEDSTYEVISEMDRVRTLPQTDAAAGQAVAIPGGAR